MVVRSLILLCVCLNSCDTHTLDVETPSTVKLDQQNEHSGILLSFDESSIFAVSDSLGQFDLPELVDSLYNITVQFPYFQTANLQVLVKGGVIEPPLEVVLNQIAEFMVLPSDTALTAQDISRVFSGYAVNLTSDKITIGSSNSHKRWAIRPAGHSWNNSQCDYCGQIETTPQGFPVLFSIDPFDAVSTGQFGISNPGCNTSFCLTPGQYEFYIVPVDATQNINHFELTSDTDLPHEVKRALNATVLKKNLFGPSLLEIKQ